MHPDDADAEQERTRQAYERADVVERYVELRSLFPVETELVARHLRPGRRVLDIGVGAGRTTPVLAADAASYVGLDISATMVDACRARFPGHRFEVGDASDLARFDDASFDAVVFSFNGIDHLHPRTRRAMCLAEMRRVVAPDGVVIFSSHRPFGLLAPTGRLRGVAPRLMVARLGRAVRRTALLSVQFATAPDLWDGSGYYRDLSMRRTRMFAATPARVRATAAAAGLAEIDRLDNTFPRRSRWWTSTFTYYVMTPSPDGDQRPGEPTEVGP
ncbi:MAG: class I SAM-dependent methyltransferase [Desertimonas sp.]